jgi:hypothetical protein
MYSGEPALRQIFNLVFLKQTARHGSQLAALIRPRNIPSLTMHVGYCNATLHARLIQTVYMPMTQAQV